MGLCCSHAPTTPSSPPFYPLYCFTSESSPLPVPFIRPHDSISTARDALIACGQSTNMQFDATEDPTRFTCGHRVLRLARLHEQEKVWRGLSCFAPRCWEVNSNLIQAVLDDGGKAGTPTVFGLLREYCRVRTAYETRRSVARKLVSGPNIELSFPGGGGDL